MRSLTIIFLFVFVQSDAQNAKFPKVKISVPCDEEFLDNYTGKWLTAANTLLNSPGNDISQGAMKRVTEIHKLIEQTYPQPMGSDAGWSALYTKTYFGDKVRFDSEGRNEPVTMTPISGWMYGMALYPWSCDGQNPKQIWNIYPELSGGNGISISANNFSGPGGMMEDDIMTIDGRPIKYMMYVIGKWKGYDLMSVASPVFAEATSDRIILITRKDESPYIQVTRKEYIDRAIAWVTKFYDKIISDTINMTDKDQAAEYKKRNLKDKEDALKKYQEELEESTKKGLLDAPAIVLNSLMNESYGPIFSTEAEGGRTLVTENPNYYRKDLPKYVPQLFVLEWSWGREGWCADFRKAIEENFPIEKLQSMIDK